MADAVGLAASILALVSAAYKSCKALNDAVSKLDDAPAHVVIIADDLEDFYSVLGILKSALEDDESAAGVLEPAMSGHLSQVLTHCKEVFKAISLIIGEFDDRNRSIVGLKVWRRLKWTFKEKEVEDARKNLTHCKLTLNMAISVANWYNIRMAAATASRTETIITTAEATVNTVKDDLSAYVKELETKLPNIMTQLEDLQALQGVHPLEHDAHDRSVVKEDFRYALRHYLDETSSLCSDWTDRSAPSFQVSSFLPTDSFLTTVYYTAKIHRTTDVGNYYDY